MGPTSSTTTITTTTSRTLTTSTVTSTTAGVCMGTFDAQICDILECTHPGVSRQCPVKCGTCPVVTITSMPDTIYKERGHTASIAIRVSYDAYGYANLTAGVRLYVIVRNEELTQYRGFVRSVVIIPTRQAPVGLPRSSSGITLELELGSWARQSSAYTVEIFLSVGGWAQRVDTTGRHSFTLIEEFAEIVSIPAVVTKQFHASITFPVTIAYSSGRPAVRLILVLRNSESSRGYITNVVQADSGAPLSSLPGANPLLRINVTLGSWAIESSRYSVAAVLTRANGSWPSRFVYSHSTRFAVENIVQEFARVASIVPSPVVYTSANAMRLHVTLEIASSTVFSVIPIVTHTATGNRKYLRTVQLAGGSSVVGIGAVRTPTIFDIDLILGSWARPQLSGHYELSVVLVRSSWNTRFARSEPLYFDIVSSNAAVGAYHTGNSSGEENVGGDVHAKHRGNMKLTTFVLACLAAAASLVLVGSAAKAAFKRNSHVVTSPIGPGINF